MKGKKKIAVCILTFLCVMMCGMTVFAAKNPVAKIGSKKYYSIQSAVNEVKNGQTIKLQRDIKVSGEVFTLMRKVSFTLDLNKHIIRCGGNRGCDMWIGKGSVTIKNGSIIGLKKDETGASISVQKGAKLYIKSGTYKNLSVDNWGGKVSITGGTFQITFDDEFDSLGFMNFEGKMELSGIKFTSTVRNGYIQNGFRENAASLTIKSGTYKAASKDAIYLVRNRGESSSSKVSILGGNYTFEGPVGGPLMNEEANAVMVIKNAVCTSKTTCIDNSGNLTVSGGKFTSIRPGYAEAVLCSGNSDASCKATVTGGTFTATGEVINTIVRHSEPFAVISGANDHMKITGGKFSCPQKPADQAVINIAPLAESFVCKVRVTVYDERK